MCISAYRLLMLLPASRHLSDAAPGASSYGAVSDTAKGSGAASGATVGAVLSVAELQEEAAKEWKRRLQCYFFLQNLYTKCRMCVSHMKELGVKSISFSSNHVAVSRGMAKD